MLKQRQAPDYRIQKMREMQDRLAQMEKANKEERQSAAVAEFETRTTAKIMNSLVTQRFEALKARREANLNVRRQRLADKLEAEDEALRQELLDSKQTPEQRRAELAARARALATKRENERQALAQSLYERAFQESCDVLRDANSKRILYRTMDERNAQIEQRMVSKIMEEEEKRMWHEMNMAESQKAEKRHLDDKRTQREQRDAMLKVLDEQVRQVQERRAEEADARRREIAELQSLWQAMALEQEAAELEDLRRMKALAAELAEFNRIKRMEISEADRRERELDLKILQEALAREAADEARETSDRAARREEVRRYREQLAQMMQREAEETAERDAMIMKQQMEQEAKRDAEMAARDEARRRLMEQVHAIRQLQIQDKMARLMYAKDEVAAERQRLEQEAVMEAAEQAERRARERKEALTRRLEVQTQMVAKAHIRAAEEDEKLRALELAAQAERAFMAKVENTLRATDPPVWHGFRKHQW